MFKRIYIKVELYIENVNMINRLFTAEETYYGSSAIKDSAIKRYKS